MLLHPEVAWRSCEDCTKYVYEERKGERLLRFGLPMLRPPGMNPPCGSCPKIPLGVFPAPRNATRVGDRELTAYRHYLECRAVGRFPDDPIVKRNAALFRRAEDEAARQEDNRRWQTLAAMMTRQTHER